jgi:hypothetical protein
MVSEMDPSADSDFLERDCRREHPASQWPAISAQVRHHHVERAVITPTNHPLPRTHRKWRHRQQFQCAATCCAPVEFGEVLV